MTDTGDPSQDVLRDLLAAERARPEPAPNVQERVLSRLVVALDLAGPGGPAGGAPPAASGGGAGASSAPARAPGPALARRLLRTQTLAVFVAGVATGVVAHGAYRRAIDGREITSRTPAAAPAFAPAVDPGRAAPTRQPPVAQEPAFAPAPAAPSPAPRAPSRSPASSQPAAADPRDRGLAAERNLLEIARSALARGQAESAVATLRRHARLFPEGELQEEREGLLVQALVAKGDYPQARERAARFSARYPRSLFAPVVTEALRSIPSIP